MADVSVIIPVYNAENTLRRCVESLALGKLRNLEIILVDDGSTDNSWALCQELARQFSQVKSLHNGENCGVSYTRNQGLKVASCEYICFVDSDDWVSEHYIEMLLHTACENPKSLPVCGLHFLNNVDDYRRTYLWCPEGELFCVSIREAFDLHERFLLPQLWNKVFRRDVIVSHGLCFDESQSIGEDFQFVLDYLRAAQLSAFSIINSPLYYYTRNSTQTLMRNFGKKETQAEFDRYAQLRDITGCQERYEQAVEGLKGNFVYHELRHSKASKAEKLEEIRRIAQDGREHEHYRALQVTKAKERVTLTISAARTKLACMWGDYRRAQNRKIIKKAREDLGTLTHPVTLISQNCIGGMLYKDMGIQFASPTIGLFFESGDFVKFAANLRHYLAIEPEFRWGEEYPIGMLEDVQIHFMHYDSCRQAKAAWQRRCQRINWENIVVLCTDRDGFCTEDFYQWQTISYKKMLFTGNEAYRDHPDSLWFKEFRRQGIVGELIPYRKFYRDSKVIQKIKLR